MKPLFTFSLETELVRMSCVVSRFFWRLRVSQSNPVSERFIRRIFSLEWRCCRSVPGTENGERTRAQPVVDKSINYGLIFSGESTNFYCNGWLVPSSGFPDSMHLNWLSIKTQWKIRSRKLYCAVKIHLLKWQSWINITNRIVDDTNLPISESVLACRLHTLLIRC